ncbi:hypothetical protein BDD43_3421 [Mucilaginibacter gracilis]|uniref:Uncharacterized protein n=1 Tax=Mucilaginibacter gracilis TaxID=423350 RepID=A0A495J5G2_9SPHI|nr:hypothetical protein [Mucilaginibacter gracilis]RKR83219.1 hypothetical protein BDD43_3421 [Mucilaginibacter gracilis]
MKYIMINQKMDNGMVAKMPIIFPNLLVHADMAELCLDLVKKMWPDKECTVVNAGEISVRDVMTGSESTTLKLRAHPLDGRIISMIDYQFMYPDFNLKP